MARSNIRAEKVSKDDITHMRMHKKKNLAARMEKTAAVLADDPSALRGRWLAAFENRTRLYVELGCGKGSFTCKTAQAEPDALMVAIERVDDALVMAMEKACAAGLDNVRFISMDAGALCDVFAEVEADRIYINFCDPWPKKKQFKRRLTAPEFLKSYKSILKDGGEIHFKTDNVPLFDWSLESFTAAGFELSRVTHDLHRDGVCGIMTDYESRFYAQGLPICRLVAKKV